MRWGWISMEMYLLYLDITLSTGIEFFCLPICCYSAQKLARWKERHAEMAWNLSFQAKFHEIGWLHTPRCSSSTLVATPLKCRDSSGLLSSGLWPVEVTKWHSSARGSRDTIVVALLLFCFFMEPCNFCPHRGGGGQMWSFRVLVLQVCVYVCVCVCVCVSISPRGCQMGEGGGLAESPRKIPAFFINFYPSFHIKIQPQNTTEQRKKYYHRRNVLMASTRCFCLNQHAR